MSLFDQMPDSYAFTEQDVDAHMKLFAKEFVQNETLTAEEEDFYHVVNEADRLRWIIKRLPTTGELRKYWEEEDEKAKQK
jgi:hypothetical protein